MYSVLVFSCNELLDIHANIDTSTHSHPEHVHVHTQTRGRSADGKMDVCIPPNWCFFGGKERRAADLSRREAARSPRQRGTRSEVYVLMCMA